jgi:hypothetical protein
MGVAAAACAPPARLIVSRAHGAGRIAELEGQLIKESLAVDQAAKAMYQDDPAAAIEYATQFGEETGAEMLDAWRAFWMELFALTRDGFTITPPTQTQCVVGGSKTGCTSRAMPVATASGCTHASVRPHTTHGAYTDDYLPARVVTCAARQAAAASPLSPRS